MTDDELSKLLAEATPGPWYSEAEHGPVNAWRQEAAIGIWSQFLYDAAIASDDDDIDAEDEAWIAGIWGDLLPRHKANARLIAAAPTLAAEVLALRAEVKTVLDREAAMYARYDAKLDAAEAALSEARATAPAVDVAAAAQLIVDNVLDQPSEKAVELRAQMINATMAVRCPSVSRWRRWSMVNEAIRQLAASGGEA